MTQSDTYLLRILQKYSPRDISIYTYSIPKLKQELQNWANTCYLNTINSGSRAKGTAISLASDVDFLVSLSSNCDGTLKEIYTSLYNYLTSQYTKVRKQNVSIRITIDSLQVDVTPARKQAGITNDHSLYLSKQDSWKQTNIQKHINDVSLSGRLNEIKLTKIWRELHALDFPSIYLEYLIINIILSGKYKGNDYLAVNYYHILKEFANDFSNPLYSRVVDPSNSGNVLSDLLSASEKQKVINQAKISIKETTWEKIVW